MTEEGRDARLSLFRVLLQERHWDNWAVFAGHFERAAREVAGLTNAPRLANITVPRRTFDRWFSGDWYGRPWPDAALVLEHLLGFPREELFRPAPDVLRPSAVFHDRGGVHASMLISRRWPTSRLFLSTAEDVSDSWEFSGGRVLDGTTAAVHFQAAFREGERVSVDDAGTEIVRRFVRPARRGLIVGVDEQAEEPRLYMVDSANARRSHPLRGASSMPVSFPAANELDDLTYGIVWALVNLDDGLLADDQALVEERQVLDAYLSLPRSAPSRLTRPDLTSVGTNWLGSHFCARHIQHRLDGVTETPVFWTREQCGEEAATWLFFRHKLDYLRSLAGVYGGLDKPVERVFLLPEEVVEAAPVSDRVLLFLAIALMERYGVRVRVTGQPEHAEVDGFALVPGRRAIVATWVRTEALWTTDTTTRRYELRGYSDAVGSAGADDLLAGADAEYRLRVLAGYLGLAWPWVVNRCHELGECGSAGLVRPRSRLIGVEALDEALHFVGTLSPGR